jgi:hypothetical protein
MEVKSLRLTSAVALEEQYMVAIAKWFLDIL